jgi:hypothetical protein
VAEAIRHVRCVASDSAFWNPANVLPILPKVLAVFGVRTG